jgi:hypothetical protein
MQSFGPVVGVMKVASDEEAIPLMNYSSYGLTASIWTEDAAAGDAMGDETTSAKQMRGLHAIAQRRTSGILKVNSIRVFDAAVRL